MVVEEKYWAAVFRLIQMWVMRCVAGALSDDEIFFREVTVTLVIGPTPICLWNEEVLSGGEKVDRRL